MARPPEAASPPRRSTDNSCGWTRGFVGAFWELGNFLFFFNGFDLRRVQVVKFIVLSPWILSFPVVFKEEVGRLFVRNDLGQGWLTFFSSGAESTCAGHP